MVMATFQPWPSSPTRSSSEMKTSSKKTSAKCEAPEIWRMVLKVIPGCFISSRKKVRFL
ncbi:unannotated protein [freshwater metagenome]|uniref:Unannotated protein n=1 Tax=freshwater metagenome TaxID=449393 RepID=A0A6J7SEM3_9ZZZZ